MSKNIDAQNTSNDVFVSKAAQGTKAVQRNKLVTCFGVSKHPKDTIGYEVRFSCADSAVTRANHLLSNACQHTKVALFQMSVPCTQLIAAHVLLNDADYLSDTRNNDACMTNEHWNAIARFISKHSIADINDAIEQAKSITIK
jgi:hypothetical protein